MEMAQSAMKQMANQMTTLYKSNTATEKANAVKETSDNEKENVPPGFKKIKKKSKGKGKGCLDKKKEPKLCKNCNCIVYHTPERCLNAWN